MWKKSLLAVRDFLASVRHQYRLLVSRWYRQFLLRLWPRYWRIKERWHRFVFRFKRRLFRWRGGLRTVREHASITGLVTKSILTSVALAVLLVVVLTLGDHWLEANDLLVPDLPSDLRIDGTGYRVLLAGIAQISGLFLGLYFTALSVLASTTYKDVPSDVRAEVLDEEAGNLYIHILALTTAIALLLLGANVAGLETGPLNFALIGILAIWSVFAFLHLGRRAFKFFDPTVLGGQLAHRIVRAVQSVVGGGFYAEDPSFQNYFQQRAESSLDTLDQVVHVAVDAEHVTDERFKELCRIGLRLLFTSSASRANIPSDSEWFKRVEQYPSWLTAEYSKVSIALETATDLRFEGEPDRLWLESRLIAIVTTIVETLVERRSLRAAAEIAAECQDAIEALSEDYHLNEALDLHSELLSLAMDEGERGPESDLTSERGQREHKYRLALIDSLAGGLRSCVVGVARAADEFSAAQIEKFTSTSCREEYQTPLERSVPGDVRNVVLDLRRAVRFERIAEGEVVTPDWYMYDLVGQSYSEYFTSSVNRLLTLIKEDYCELTERLSQAQAYNCVPRAVQLGLESCEKIVGNFDRLSGALDELTQLKSEATGTDWPSLSPDALHTRLDKIRDDLFVLLARDVSNLETEFPVGEGPDDPGFAYTFLAQECYQTLTRGKIDLFRRLFPAFFELTLTLIDRLRRELEDQRAETQLIFTSDLIVDLLELSGYALVFSQIRSEDSWDVAKNVWEAYLKSLPDPKSTLEFLVGLYGYRETQFRMSTRGIIRTSWTQDFQQRMEREGFAEDRLGSGWSRYGSELDQVPISRVARTVLRGVGPEPRTAFVAFYLLRRPAAAGITPPRKVQQFLDSVDQRPGSVDLVRQ